jgi:hypothetical protein
LIPFTRWITPPGVPKRFTTQMYLFMLPLSLPSGAAAVRQEAIVPTPDGGIEHTAATFDHVSSWLARAQTGEVLLLPPQAFLLTLLARFLTGTGSTDAKSTSTTAGGQASTPSTEELQAQRDELLAFLARIPTAQSPRAAAHPTSRIPWADKAMSPHVILGRSDGRVVLALDKPGLELKDSGRGGDYETVVLARFTKNGAVDVEVRDREEVLNEERKAAAGEEAMRDEKL